MTNAGKNYHTECQVCGSWFPRWAGTATGDFEELTASPQTDPLKWGGDFLCGPCADVRKGRCQGPVAVKKPVAMGVDDTKAFLDKSVTYWQALDAAGIGRAKHYADAYQTMLFVVFGVQE